MRAPPWWARKGVALAAHLLPSGPIRERYRQEFLAELYVMTRWQAAKYVFEVAKNARRLRAAVVVDIDRATTRTTVAVACRLNLHHDWRMFHTEDGGRYKACARCDKEQPDWRPYTMWRYPGDNIRRSFGA